MNKSNIAFKDLYVEDIIVKPENFKVEESSWEKEGIKQYGISAYYYDNKGGFKIKNAKKTPLTKVVFTDLKLKFNLNKFDENSLKVPFILKMEDEQYIKKVVKLDKCLLNAFYVFFFKKGLSGKIPTKGTSTTTIKNILEKNKVISSSKKGKGNDELMEKIKKVFDDFNEIEEFEKQYDFENSEYKKLFKKYFTNDGFIQGLNHLDEDDEDEIENLFIKETFIDKIAVNKDTHTLLLYKLNIKDEEGNITDDYNIYLKLSLLIKFDEDVNSDIVDNSRKNIVLWNKNTRKHELLKSPIIINKEVANSTLRPYSELNCSFNISKFMYVSDEFYIGKYLQKLYINKFATGKSSDDEVDKTMEERMKQKMLKKIEEENSEDDNDNDNDDGYSSDDFE